MAITEQEVRPAREMIRRFSSISMYLAGGILQIFYSLTMAAVARTPSSRLWPGAVAALLMILVLACLTWGRQRRIKTVTRAAIVASAVFILSYATIASISVFIGEQLPMGSQLFADVGERALYLFVLTGDAWVAFILCMAVGGAVTRRSAWGGMSSQQV